ncbi:ABC transporter ATP-binding protein [Arthrobacter sp. 7Tela_A1]|uniref:ABC transporter ATP-binding protein n=1 Tax=Arthrobacter sp. 7Tela_A1 TaxID=3093745 RepID=UPI003BB54F83
MSTTAGVRPLKTAPVPERGNGISLRGVSVHLPTADGELQILRNVTIDVPAGKIVALAGESGSGKSTAMLAMVRLLPWGARVGGELVVGPHEVTAMDAGRMRGFRASYARVVFQDPWSALHAMHSIGSQLVESARSADPGLSKAAARELAVAMLSRVGIPDPEARMRSYPHQVSGGQLQRIVIAMALVAKPQVLLCDEPTTALDVTTQEQILELLRELNVEMGLTIVIATHDLDVIDGLADHLVVMYGGTVMEQGPMKQVMGNPQHPYTWSLLQAQPKRQGKGRLLTIPGRPPALDDLPPGCAFAPRCASAAPECSDAVPRLLAPHLPDHRTACIRVQQASTPAAAQKGTP